MANTDPFRERKWYRMEKCPLISLILALAIPIPFVISMLSMKLYVSLGVYAATYLFLVFIVGTYVRRSRLNAYHIIDSKVITKTIKDLHTSRIAEKKLFLSTELTELLKGKKLPVLDSWKTDAQLKLRHNYFSQIVHIIIDPQKEEMELLIQLPAIKIPKADELNNFRKQFFARIAGFLKIAVNDPRLEQFKDLFSTFILEFDTVREDEKGYDIPVPVFSMKLPAEQLWKLSTVPQFQEIAFERIGDVRFSNSSEVEPHRMMRA